MEALRQFFETNQTIVLAVYGQGFFTLGIALAVQSLKRTHLRLGKHLQLLATFGIMHGLCEWGDVFIPIQGTYLPPATIALLRWLQLALMVASFGFLLQFGLRNVLKSGPLQTPVGGWVVVIFMITLAAALSVGRHDQPDARQIAFEIWIRYLVAAPGSILSALGTLNAVKEVRAMQLPRIGRWLTISAVSLLGYASLNLITPHYRLLMSGWYNYDEVLLILGVPAQVLRTIATAGLLYGMVRSLSVFEIETDRIIADAEHRKAIEARHEVETMERIAITLGTSRDPALAMSSVLSQVLPFLHCTSGEIALWEDGTWKPLAHVGDCANAEPADWSTSPLIAEVRSAGQVVITQEPGFAVGIPISVGSRFLAAAAIYGDQPVEISEQELQVVASLGILIGISLENSRLWAEVQRREVARTHWINRIITAQEDERRRISLELHDDAIQTLVTLCRKLDALEATAERLPEPLREGLEAARIETEELIAALRRFAQDLRPPALDDLGLSASLRRLLAEFETRTHVRSSFEVTGTPSRLSRDTEIGLFRITQEAIRNVEKHAQAQSVIVRLAFETDGVNLRVTDDGRGVSQEARRRAPSATGGLGILGMQERASLLGGHLTLLSGSGKGTTVSVSVPLNRPTQPDN